MPAKLRVNVTVDAETLRLADHLTRARKISRNAVFREGVHAPAENQARQVEERALRESQRRAAATMNHLAHKFGDWPAGQILHNMHYPLERGRCH